MNNNYIFPFLWMRGEGEAVIRTEIEKIYECGIRAICIEARPHDDFCGPGWWHDVDIVLDEARKREMKIWILDDKHFPTGYANGLIEKCYPERKKQYIACSTADIFGSSRLQSLNVSRMLKPSIGFWEIGNPVDYEERARNRLLALIAVRFREGDLFTEETLDLTDSVKDGIAEFKLPAGQWRVHAIFITRTDGGDPSYINMIDSVSAHTQIEGVYEAHYEKYGSEFGKTIAGFFSDEPQFGNISDQVFDTKLGRPKMPLPWSDELAEMLKERYPDGYYANLPFLFAASAEKQIEPQFRYDYMDCISKLYAKNFARPIGQWCHDHGVEYIGHVVEDNGVHSRLGLGPAHWFRAMEGQDMAGIDMISGQYYFGAPVEERKAMTPCDGEFFHYTLGKLGASSGHLDPRKKGRTMCEAFGAYGWGFGVRDMKYLADHLLSRGVNHFVPHAFSMAEYPDIDCPPHFYARGHNPEFPYFAELMKYTNRMCDQLNGGRHVASVAVLYDGEFDWTCDAMPMQKVCRELTENQIDFDIVSLDMLRDLPAWNGCVKDGKLVINNVCFDALLIPRTDYAPAGLIDFARAANGFPVIFIDRLPCKILNDESGSRYDQKDLSEMHVAALDKISEIATEKGCRKINVEPAFRELSFYHYEKDVQKFFFMNESPDKRFDGYVDLPAKKSLLYYDALEDRYERAEASEAADRAVLKLVLEPGESCLIVECDNADEYNCHKSFAELKKEAKQSFDISEGWKITCRTSDGEVAATDDSGKMLAPISHTLPAFSGTIEYEREVMLDEIPDKALFTAENIGDVCSMKVNGKRAGVCLVPPYRFDISGLLEKGINKLTVEVATTPARDQLNYPMAPFDFKYETMEATGMYGKVQLETA